MFTFFGLSILVLFFGAGSATASGNINTSTNSSKAPGHEFYSRTTSDLFEQRNRDGELPIFSVEPDLRLQSSYILNAHEILRKALEQFLAIKDADLGTYLNYLIHKRTEPFADEYGQVIRVYKKVFHFIWEQYNETLVQNYAIKQFNKDKLILCSVARYLSHQPTVEQRGTIMKRMGDALEYRCHPCTPYTPKQYDETIVPSTDGINPEGVSPEESLRLCKENKTEGQNIILPASSDTTTTPPPTSNPTLTSIDSVNGLHHQSSYIVEANEVLRKGLKLFLGFKDADLGTYLSYLIYKRTEPFVDEYGQVIRVYKKVFRFIWEQYNETSVQNYKIGHFNKDKLDLCSVARYLSHQPTVDNRETIMKRMSDALNYTCHPCTPYTPKQYEETIVPSTDGINPEGVSPEESLILCKKYQMQGQDSLPSFGISTTTPGTISTTVESIKPENPSIDFSPCSYSDGNVLCDKVPLEEVQKVFTQTVFFPRLASAKLILNPKMFSETFLPEDVFGTKKIWGISIEYPLSSCCDKKLLVHADAFQSTKNYTSTFTLNMIDCTLLDLTFLTGFNKLGILQLTNINNIQHCLPSLPPLPRLITLNFDYCSGLNDFYNFPALTNGLKQFRFENDDVTWLNLNKIINDETVDRAMDWLLISSANTLEDLTITKMNQVTRVPHNITAFKALRRVWFYGNNITTLKSGAFSFSVPVSLLNILDNGINEIEPGAFQGDFKDAEFYVYNNNLTRFEESVFGSILQQMASGKGFIGAAYDNGNPIDCSYESICHLNWLRRYQVDFKFWLTCSNGTSFKDLQPAGFNHCLL